MPDTELTALFTGYGYKPHFVEGDQPELMHQLMAETLRYHLGARFSPFRMKLAPMDSPGVLRGP